MAVLYETSLFVHLLEDSDTAVPKLTYKFWDYLICSYANDILCSLDLKKRKIMNYVGGCKLSGRLIIMYTLDSLS